MKIKRLLKKEKTYALTPSGRMQMEFDIGKAKEAKVSGIVSVIVIVGMFTLGFLSWEFVSMILVSKGISKVTNILVG